MDRQGEEHAKERRKKAHGAARLVRSIDAAVDFPRAIGQRSAGFCRYLSDFFAVDRHSPAARAASSGSDSVELHLLGEPKMDDSALGLAALGPPITTKTLGKPPPGGAKPPLPTGKQPVSFPVTTLNLAFTSERGRLTPSFTPAGTPHGAPGSAMRYGMTNRTGSVPLSKLWRLRHHSARVTKHRCR